MVTFKAHASLTMQTVSVTLLTGTPGDNLVSSFTSGTYILVAGDAVGTAGVTSEGSFNSIADIIVEVSNSTSGYTLGKSIEIQSVEAGLAGSSYTCQAVAVATVALASADSIFCNTSSTHIC